MKLHVMVEKTAEQSPERTSEWPFDKLSINCYPQLP